MKAKSISTNELSLELKYCERCGGLWLRPAGGKQVYCAVCGREIAELPPASPEARNARVPRKVGWGMGGDRFEGDEEVIGMYPDTTGGVE
jgi:hypothetical protein